MSVVSYQTRDKKTDTFVISQPKAVAYRERMKEGDARLAALEMPDLPLLPADAPLMTAPSDLIAGDGLTYLVQRGYLQKAGAARDYICEKARALRLSKGSEPRRGCGMRGAQNAYTILGPITYPTGLCGAHSVAFLLPPGVAEPKGSPCHSDVIALEDMPCLGDRGECRQQRRRKNPT